MRVATKREIAKIVVEELRKIQDPTTELLRNLVKEQQAKIAELLDRLMAKNFQDYKIYEPPMSIISNAGPLPDLDSMIGESLEFPGGLDAEKREK